MKTFLAVGIFATIFGQVDSARRISSASTEMSRESRRESRFRPDPFDDEFDDEDALNRGSGTTWSDENAPFRNGPPDESSLEGEIIDDETVNGDLLGSDDDHETTVDTKDTKSGDKANTKLEKANKSCDVSDSGTFCPRFVRTCKRTCANPLKNPTMICYMSESSEPVYHCACGPDHTQSVISLIEPTMAGCLHRKTQCTVRLETIFNSDGRMMVSGVLEGIDAPGEVDEWVVFLTTDASVKVDYVVNGSLLGQTDDSLLLHGDKKVGETENGAPTFAVVLRDSQKYDFQQQHCHARLSIAPKRSKPY